MLRLSGPSLPYFQIQLFRLQLENQKQNRSENLSDFVCSKSNSQELVYQFEMQKTPWNWITANGSLSKNLRLILTFLKYSVNR